MTSLTFALFGPLVFGHSPESGWADQLVGLLLLTGPPAYLVSTVVGLPGYYLLRRRGWLSPKVVITIGGLLGIVAGLVVDFRYVALVLLCGVAGLLSAVVLILIAGNSIFSEKVSP